MPGQISAVSDMGGAFRKSSVNAGFTCPNRDGTVGLGGCTFCNNEGFNPSYCHLGDSITEQIDKGIRFLDKRYKRPGRYVAYFQAFSNTHAPLPVLQQRYGEALAHPRISGLVAGTRPDCVDAQKLDYLASLSPERFISVEYGVESCYDDTLQRINRGHTFSQSVEAIKLTALRGLHVGIHMIFGLPGENRQRILEQAAIISSLPINTVKFHQLQIVKGTPMAEEYARDAGNFKLFSMDEYIDLVIAFTERLHPGIAIERFSGEVPPQWNAGPGWNKTRTDQVLHLIEERMAAQDTWQGKYWQET
jgi:uncharacterized protein